MHDYGRRNCTAQDILPHHMSQHTNYQAESICVVRRLITANKECRRGVERAGKPVCVADRRNSNTNTISTKVTVTSLKRRFPRTKPRFDRLTDRP